VGRAARSCQGHCEVIEVVEPIAGLRLVHQVGDAREKRVEAEARSVKIEYNYCTVLTLLKITGSDITRTKI